MAEPRISAYETFFSLARGPGVQRVSKGPNHWVIRTPEGKIVRLRNPKASSTRDWTVDVVLPDGREWHFKFKPSGA